jgi:hypothetical protein
MITIEELQDPQSLRLAIGELNATELGIARAAVRFAHSCLTKSNVPVPNKITLGNGDNACAINEQYVKGWNDCGEAMLSKKEH